MNELDMLLYYFCSETHYFNGYNACIVYGDLPIDKKREMVEENLSKYKIPKYEDADYGLLMFDAKKLSLENIREINTKYKGKKSLILMYNADELLLENDEDLRLANINQNLYDDPQGRSENENILIKYILMSDLPNLDNVPGYFTKHCYLENMSYGNDL
jgi:hypothetical protein